MSYLPLAHRLADAAARETLPRFRTPLAVDDKDAGATAAEFDPVTEADREAERAMRAVIADEAPGHGVLGEEFPETPGDGEYRWVLDPVDGTRAFVCGVPVWTTLIGLERAGAPVLGVIDQPVTGERWWGGEGVPAMLRRGGQDAPARVSGCEALADARLMVTDLRCAPGAYLTKQEAQQIGLLASSCRLTRQGLDSYAFGLLASGHIDLVVEAGLSWYDIAAVIPVVSAAGGCVATWEITTPPEQSDMADWGMRGRTIFAATEKLAQEAIDFLIGWT